MSVFEQFGIAKPTIQMNPFTGKVNFLILTSNGQCTASYSERLFNNKQKLKTVLKM